MKTIRFITLILIAVTIPSVLSAQSKVGTTVGQFLKVEPDARIAAMGNSGTAVFGNAAASFYNPGSLGKLQSTDVQFTYNKWFADISYNYGIAATHLSGIGTLSLQLTSLNSGEIDVRTVEQPLGTGERYSVNSIAIGLGYGTMLTDRVSVGIIINLIQESIWHSTMTNFGLNFGVLYQVEEGGLTLGASVSNFGPRSGYDGRDLYIDYDFDPDKYGDNDGLPAELRTDDYSLPTVFRVGISYPITISRGNSLLLSVDALHPNDNYEKLSVGAEWTFFEMFAVRGGYRDLFVDDSEGGLMLGAGINLKVNDYSNVRFDYAWADYGRLDQVHRFTVGLGL